MKVDRYYFKTYHFKNCVIKSLIITTLALTFLAVFQYPSQSFASLALGGGTLFILTLVLRNCRSSKVNPDHCHYDGYVINYGGRLKAIVLDEKISEFLQEEEDCEELFHSFGGMTYRRKNIDDETAYQLLKLCELFVDKSPKIKRKELLKTMIDLCKLGMNKEWMKLLEKGLTSGVGFWNDPALVFKRLKEHLATRFPHRWPLVSFIQEARFIQESIELICKDLNASCVNLQRLDRLPITLLRTLAQLIPILSFPQMTDKERSTMVERLVQICIDIDIQSSQEHSGHKIDHITKQLSVFVEEIPVLIKKNEEIPAQIEKNGVDPQWIIKAFEYPEVILLNADSVIQTLIHHQKKKETIADLDNSLVIKSTEALD